MINTIREGLTEIHSRFLRKDFSGNKGLVIKNSIYQTSTNIIAKIGSLLFTIIIARMLLPDLFGLYSLALATIIIFSGFSDLGITTALIRYVAQKDRKSWGPVRYLFKIKVYLTILVIITLGISAYFISNYYYQKPIFYALLAGMLYIIFLSFMGFFASLFQAENNFKRPMYREIIFQISRLTILPLVVLWLIHSSSDVLIAGIILSLSACLVLSSFAVFRNLKYYSGKDLNYAEKRKTNQYLLPLSATVLSGSFFGYVDTIILGRFVESTYIGFYQAAFALIGSLVALISFGGVLMPIFSRLKESSIKRNLNKIMAINLLISGLAILLTLLFSNLVINIIYGQEYSSASLILKVLSIVLITDPLITIYSSYLYSRGRTKKVAKAILMSTALNIALNLIFILYLLQYGQIAAVLGAASATIISRFVYLGLLVRKS